MNKYLVVLMIAGMITAACGQTDNASSNAGGDGDIDAEQASSGEELTWFSDDFNAASAEAEVSGKFLLIDMYADWCGPCVTLGEQYFKSEEMRPILSKFVLLRLDVDSQVGGSYAQHYGVTAIPCIVIASNDGTEIDRIVGTTPTIGAYVDVLESILQNI